MSVGVPDMHIGSVNLKEMFFQVVDIDTGAALPANTDGELLVAGPQVGFSV